MFSLQNQFLHIKHAGNRSAAMAPIKLRVVEENVIHHVNLSDRVSARFWF